MTGPVLYEASVPFLLKAMRNQIEILRVAEKWCHDTDNHDPSELTKLTLQSDMSVCITNQGI
ncbi:MAG: hypothetical protein FE78DRAFT_90165 [Acidomyces sp. 'richmondensis']|nr:MAG: hypothetical protein FE78DRAFT_90165 [Acidomyces sp. 'richmondensis']